MWKKTFGFLIACLVQTALASAATLTVDLNGGADYTEIQAAIDAAADGDTVLVKPGEYVITEPINFNRLHDPDDPASLPVKNIVVKSEGGAEETTIRMSGTPFDSSRARVVIFANGEGEDSALDGFKVTGARRTVRFDNGNQAGGGVYCGSGSSPTLTNCTISGNSVWAYGGGVYCESGSSPTLTNCRISANSATDGGGVFCSRSSPTLTECIISGNSAVGGTGGGLHCEGGSPTLTNCTISENFGYIGGGIDSTIGSFPTLTNCTITGNTAWSTGGACFDGLASVNLTKCTISGNFGADHYGLVCLGYSTLISCIVWGNAGDSLIATGNDHAEFVSAGSVFVPTGMILGTDGNLYVCSQGSSEVFKFHGTYGSFLGGFASGDGLSYPGDIVYGPDGYVYITNSGSDEWGWESACTVRRHDPVTGEHLGDFVPCGSGGLDGATCLIFWERDGAHELLVSSLRSDSVLRYDGTTGAFIDTLVPSQCGGLSAPYGLAIGPDGHLYVCSSNSSQILRYDGSTGTFLGVFVEAESGGMSIPKDVAFGPDGNLYATSAGTGEVLRYDGSSGEFIDVFASGVGMVDAEGLLFVRDGYLYVAGGRGDNVLRYDGMTGAPFGSPSARSSVTFSCIDGPEVFPGEGNINEDPLFCGWQGPEEVFVDASNANPGEGTKESPFRELSSGLRYSVSLRSDSPCVGTGKDGGNMGASAGTCENEGRRERIVHVGAGQYPLQGFNLTQRASILGNGQEVTILEGTVWGLRTGATLSGVTVTNGKWGGIVVGIGEGPEINGCKISGNSAESIGWAGVNCLYRSFPTLTNCTISGNSTAGMYCLGPAILKNCTISGNSAFYGGGLHCGHFSPIVTNCMISGNSTGWGGGGVSCYNSSPILTNCTITGNSGFGEGGAGIDCGENSSPRLTNCIVWGNSPESLCGSRSYCLTHQDPLFVQPGEWNDCGSPDDPGCLAYQWQDETPVAWGHWTPGDFHLHSGSPAIDAGTSEGAPSTDIEGRIRPCGAGVDIGAYEYGNCWPSPAFIRGDSNADGTFDISDPVATLCHLFLGTGPLHCLDAADSNDSGVVDLSDAVYSLQFLFIGGPAPESPYPECGVDPVIDDLSCEAFPACQ